MATEEQLQSITLEASGDLSTKQYHFMVIDSSGQIAAAGAGAAIDGVLQDEPDAAGIASQVGFSGVTKVNAAEAIVAGDDITPDSAGKAVVAATGDVIAGKATSGASGSGFIFSMLLNPQKEPVA